MYKKLIALGLLIIGSMVLLSFLGIAIASLFWHEEVSAMLNHTESISNLSNVSLLKFLQAFSQIGTFILPVILFLIFTEGNIIKPMKIKLPKRAISAILAILLIIAVVPFINFLLTLNSYLQLPAFMSSIENWMRTTEDSAAVLTQSFLQVTDIQGYFVNIFVIALIPAIGEEMLFRGVIQSILVKNMKNKHLAVWLSAIIFSAIHMQFFGFLPRMVLGLVLGYLFLWSDSLLLSMLAHFSNNAFAVTLAYLGTIHSIPQETGDMGSSSSEWLVILISTLIASALFYLIYKQENIIKTDI
ncbi:MAG: CPBP family intramembrane glutamic endopeptidase [Bacteroidota bacterium]